MAEHADITRARQLLRNTSWDQTTLGELAMICKRSEDDAGPLGRVRYAIVRAVWYACDPALNMAPRSRLQLLADFLGLDTP